MSSPLPNHIALCACPEGVYYGAQKVGTVLRCERCGFMPRGEHASIISAAFRHLADQVGLQAPELAAMLHSYAIDPDDPRPTRGYLSVHDSVIATRTLQRVKAIIEPLSPPSARVIQSEIDRIIRDE